MGYQLECYGIDAAPLQALIGSGRTEVVRQVVANEVKLFVTNPGEPWRQALQDLIAGDRGRALASARAADPNAPPSPATPAEAAAMTALIRHFGDRAGVLIHNSRAGEKFRAMFDPGFEPPQFVETSLAPRLLGRPLAGLSSTNYPCWGGLTQAEVARMLGGHSEPAEAPVDIDQRQWLWELNEVLVDVRDWKTDLVTLYL